MNILLKGYDYLMNDCYERISIGKYYDISYKPYSKDFILKVVKYFEIKEEYEKCKTLTEFLNIKLDHEKRYSEK